MARRFAGGGGGDGGGGGGGGGGDGRDGGDGTGGGVACCSWILIMRSTVYCISNIIKTLVERIYMTNYLHKYVVFFIRDRMNTSFEALQYYILTFCICPDCFFELFDA